MINNFLGSEDVVPFSQGPENPDAVWFKGCLENEITLGFNMDFEQKICPQCVGVSFILSDIDRAKKVTFNFEYLNSSNFSLNVELKDKSKRVYKSFNVTGRENLPLSGIVRNCTSEICIVCTRKENAGKKGEVRIYL